MDYQELDYSQEEIDKEFKLLLEQWRDKYYTLYVSEINEIEFVWRGLSRGEYRKAMEYYQDDFDRAEFVCRLCILDPIVDDWASEIPAGIPETLAKHILEESGFAGDARKIKSLQLEYEAEMNKFENQISCVIKEVFNEFTLEDIDNWPLEKTMWHFARAKWILRELRGIPLEEEENPIPGVPKI